MKTSEIVRLKEKCEKFVNFSIHLLTLLKIDI